MLFGTQFRLVTSLVALLLLGCAAGGYRTSTRDGHEKVYRVGEEGAQTLVYEVAADGTLTVHDRNDPRAQQLLAAQEQQKELQVLEEERIARIREAPKRAADDPIRVVFHRIDVEEKLREAQHTEGAIEDQLRQEFQGDEIIRLVQPVASKGSELTQAFLMLTGQTPTEALSAAPAADVEVVTRAYVEEKVGYDKSSKKLGTMAALVFEATIRSNYLPVEHTVKEEGNVFRNAEITKRFADRIKDVIKNRIGPTIPADRNL